MEGKIDKQMRRPDRKKEKGRTWWMGRQEYKVKGFKSKEE